MNNITQTLHESCKNFIKKNISSVLLMLMLFVGNLSFGQTYYNMASGNYNETFTSWTTPATGVNWSSLAANTGTIPTATVTTLQSTSFVTTTAGGLQNGNTNIQFLTTGNTNNTSSVAFDLNLNFTGRNAGFLSFNAAQVINGSGNRGASLKVYYSTNGTTWTELSATNLPFNAINNVASSAVVNVALPAALNNQATVKLRFYNHNGPTLGTSGNRPKISIDDVVVTSTGAYTNTGATIVNGGVNFVGQPQNPTAYAQPTNCTAGDYRVLNYRKVSTTANNTTDGRGQWFTTVLAQSAGGNAFAGNYTGGSNNGFLFTSGGGCNATGNFNDKWNFGGVGQASLNAINGTTLNSSTDMGLNMSTPGYYTFSMKDVYNTNGPAFYVGYTTYPPVNIISTTQTAVCSTTATVTATLSAAPSSQEAFYLRFRATTNDFTASTSQVLGTVSGNTVTFNLTGLTNGVTYFYYLLSTTHASYTTLSEVDKSLSCLRALDNSGNNYSFTTAALAPSITTQPSNSTSNVGSSTTYTVAATNAATYQWQYATTVGGIYANVVNATPTGTTYSGTTTATLTVTTTTTATGSAYFYRCVVTSACGSSVNTNGAQMIVYCAATGNTTFSTGTTLVNYAGINNATPTKTAGYNNYTAQNAVVTAGAANNITINVNSGGNYTVFTRVYIDWDQNGVFNTTTGSAGGSGETYLLGSAVNVTNGVTSLSPLSITVPSGAALGITRMRVVTIFGSGGTDPFTTTSMCLASTDAEVEDYTVTVAAGCTQPATQATIGAYTANTTGTSLTVNWTRGNGTGGVIVVARATATANQIPVGGTTYTPSTVGAFGGTTTTGTGNIVIYNGTGTSVNVTGLTAGTSYTFSVYEYNTTSTCYLTPASASAVTTDIPPVAYTWVGFTNSSWNTNTNWSPNGVPSSLDSVTITNGSTGAAANLSLTTAVTVNNITFNGIGNFFTVGASPAAITATGTVTYTGGSGTWNATSTFTISSASSQTIPAFNYGNLNATGGARVWTGSATTGIAGTFTPGAGTYTATSGSTVNFNGAGTQTIGAVNYNDLTISGARGTATITLATGTIDVSGSLTFSATGTITFSVAGNTVNFSSASSQTIPAFTYLNITNTGNGPRTLASTGTIQLLGTLTPGSGLYTNTGSTVSYTATSGTVNVNLPSVSSGNSYNILTINGAAGTFQIDAAAVSPINLATTLNVTAGTFNLNTTATNKTFNVGTLNVNGGTLNSVTGTGLPIVNVSGNMALSSGTVNLNSATTTSPTSEMYVTGTYTQTGGTINLQNNTNATGNTVAYLKVTGDFTLTAGTFEFATAGVQNTSTNFGQFDLLGNFIRNGTANTIAATGSQYNGFIEFRGTTQSINVTTTTPTTNFIETTINSGSTTSLLSNYASGRVVVDAGGTLLCSDKLVTGAAFINNGTLGIGNSAGITAAVATDTGNIRAINTRTFNTTANYIYNGSVAQVVGTGLPLTVNNLTIANSNASGVTLNNATNLTVNGTLTLTSNPLKYGTGASTITINGPITTTSGSIVGNNSTSNITIASTGAVTNALALSGSFGAFTWSRLLGGAISGSFNVAGNWTNGATTGSTIDLTTNTTTITLNGSAQTLSGNTTFNNLTINAAGAKDFGATTTTIAGIFNQTAGSMTTIGANTFIFTGAAGSIAGNIAKNFVNLTISGSGVTTNANSGTVNITGNYANSGTFTSNPATTINFKAGAAQTLSGTGTSSFGNFTISSNTTNTTVNAGSHNFSVTGAIFDVAANQIFNGQTNTVTFAGGATTSVIDGAGTYNFNGVTINNASTLSNGTNSRNFAVSGNWANNGTYTAGTETISFTGTSAQTVGGSAQTTFNSVTVSGAGGGLSLGNSQTINGTLTLSATSGGNINLNGNNNVTLGATATITGETCSRQFINSGSPTQGNGYVQTTRTLDTNPGNVASLGLNIQTATALGSTNIKRFEKAVSSVGAGNSVARVYSITPSTAATGNVTLTTSYCDGELNSNSESAPVLITYYGTGTNETTGFSNFYANASNDANANTVTTLGTGSLIVGQNNITLANPSPDAYYTVQDGDWNTAATWVLNAVPPAGVATIIKNAVTVNGAVTNAPSSITINSGKSLTFGASGTITTTNLTNNGSVVMTNGGTLTIANGGTFANGTNTFTSGTGTLAFSAGGATTGTITIAIGAKLSVASGTLNNASGTLNIDGTFQINQGGFASGGTWNYGTTGTLVYNNISGVYGDINGIDNNHSYWPSSNSPINITVLGAGGINLGVSRTVSGIFQTAAGVTLSSGAVLTLNGTCQINANGFFNNAPTYGGSSTLIYNTGGTYGRGSEWNALSGAGYPANVQIGNGVINTILNVINNDNSFKKASGNLTVSAGSTFSIDGLTAQNGSTGVGVEFVGNLINSGNITLSGTTNKRLKGVSLTNNGTVTLAANIGADLELSGNYTDNATFNANARAVFFTGSGTQTISGTATAPFNIDYIVITKPSGIVQLGVDLLTGAPNGGNGITLTSSNDIFDLNGKTFTIGTAAQTCTISGSGLIRSASNNPGTMNINGTGAMGTLTFETANNTLAGLTINRTGTGTPGVTLGSTLNVTTTLALTSTTTLTLGGNLTVSASSSNTVAGMIAGTGALVKTGSGTLTLTASSGNNTTNSYSAGTTVNEAGSGTISVTGLTNITSASIASDSQSVTFSTTTPTNGTYQLLPNALTVGTQNFTHNAAPTKGVTLNYTNSTITVGQANITTSAISPTTYCAGDAVTISFITDGNLSGTYTAQLSDATGSFTSPVAIGTSATNSISGTIPLAASSGTGYRIRVVNIGNSITGSDNGANITINANLPASVSITASPGDTVCAGTSVTFTATPTNGGTTPIYQWYVGATAVGTNSATYTSSALTNGNTVSVVMTSNATPCLTGSPATSNGISMTVSNNISWIGTTGLWSNGANWSCGSVPLDTSIITISSGTPTLDTNFTVGSTGSLTLSGTSSLIINSTASLTVAGSANFNGNPVTFKSDVNGTAEFGPLTGTLSGATNVTTERYFSARRAFRFTSSAVTTSTTINANWQEGVNNSNTTFSNNQNPNPGFGTHITGAGGSANGFDTTISNTNSLFTYNNSTSAWTAVANTTTNTLNAGVPYRINVRGDRSIDMSLTNPTATATVLRATGTLYTGQFNPGNLSAATYAYNLVGNPYQAPVNMKTVLDNATNLINSIYYVWDPKMGSRGAYISVDLNTNTPNNITSYSNKFLQPGLACFVRTAALGGTPVMNFQESYKDLTASNSLVFKSNTNQSTSAISNIKMRLYDSNSLALNQTALDGSVIFFDDLYNNGVDQNDGAKFTNPDEMFSTFNNGALISIEKRMQPTTSDIIPIRISQYRGTNYTIVAQGENLNGIPAYLHDQFLQTYTEIPQSGAVNYPYSVVTTNTQTTATDRFRIVYSNPLLSTANNEWKNFTLYPNPSKQGNFNIILGQPLENGKVTIYNTLGVKVYSQDLENTIENSITPNKNMPTGIYYVEIQNGSERSIKKLIIE